MPRHLLPILLYLCLVGCGSATATSTTVDRPVAETRAKIDAMTLPDDLTAIFHTYGGVSAQRRDTATGLAWDFDQDGTRLGSYDVAIAEAEPGKSNVSGQFVAKDAGKPAGDHVDASTMVAELAPAVLAAAIERSVTGQPPLGRSDIKALSERYTNEHRAEGEALTRRLMGMMGS